MITQLKSEDERVALDLDGDRATLLMDGEALLTLEVERVEALTVTRARELSSSTPDRGLVVFARSSPQARALLRELGTSYASESGELWVHAPPIHVERPAPRRAAALTPEVAAPFAIRASRVPRWLLLNPGQSPTFHDLGVANELSASIVSRTVRALADDGLVTIETDPHDARRRRVRLRNARAMLDAFERAAASRRPRRQTWDVGARDARQAMTRLRTAAKHLRLPYAVSGVAGASFIRRAVEPGTVDAWIGRDSLQSWMDELGAIPSRPGSGRLTIQTALDPFVLSLAFRRDGFLIADPVQLYLDCRRAGERALEAADAVREEMNW